MNKYQTISDCLENWQLGFMSGIEALDRIVTAWCNDNGGRMDYDDLVEMVEYIEGIEWWWMAHFMQGYFWGARTDDPAEASGEQWARMRNQEVMAGA